MSDFRILSLSASRQRTFQLVKVLAAEGSKSKRLHSATNTYSNAVEQRALAGALFASAPLESSPYWLVNSAIEGFSALHSTTGLPWWATLALAAAGEVEPPSSSLAVSQAFGKDRSSLKVCKIAGIRLTLSPLTVLQLKSLARNRPLLQQAHARLLQRNSVIARLCPFFRRSLQLHVFASPHAGVPIFYISIWSFQGAASKSTIRETAMGAVQEITSKRSCTIAGLDHCSTFNSGTSCKEPTGT